MNLLSFPVDLLGAFFASHRVEHFVLLNQFDQTAKLNIIYRTKVGDGG